MIRARRDPPSSVAPPDPGAVETILGKATQLKGDLKSAGSLRIDGRVEGTIETTGDLIVGESGMVVADVQAASVLVAGEIQGQVRATARLEVAASGRIRGDVETPVLVVNEGGRLDGKCSMTTQDRPSSSASRPSGDTPEGRTPAPVTPLE